MNPAELFADIERRYGLPSGYLNRTWQIESSSGRNLLNPQSGAAGHFQFMPRTAKQYGLENPNDLAQSAEAAARLAADNRRVLQRAGIENPSASELYLAHQQGAGGATKLLSGGDRSAADIVGKKAVEWNAGNTGMTGQEFAQSILNKFGRTGGGGGMQVASADDGSMGFMARRLLSGATGGLLGGNDGGKIPFDAERPYSPSFTAPQQPMGAQFAGAAPLGGIGSVPGGASAALTSRPLPEPDKGWSMDNWSNKDIAGLASVGNFLMAAGAPKQTWKPTPLSSLEAVRGRWRDDLFAGLLG